MRAAIFQEPRSITSGDRPDATITATKSLARLGTV
jgi:hypothetical protein